MWIETSNKIIYHIRSFNIFRMSELEVADEL